MIIENGTWYTATEVCDLLKVSTTTLWRWRREGVLAPYQFGKKTVRYRGVNILRAAAKQAMPTFSIASPPERKPAAAKTRHDGESQRSGRRR